MSEESTSKAQEQETRPASERREVAVPAAAVGGDAASSVPVVVVADNEERDSDESIMTTTAVSRTDEINALPAVSVARQIISDARVDPPLDSFDLDSQSSTDSLVHRADHHSVNPEEPPLPLRDLSPPEEEEDEAREDIQSPPIPSESNHRTVHQDETQVQETTEAQEDEEEECVIQDSQPTWNDQRPLGSSSPIIAPSSELTELDGEEDDGQMELDMPPSAPNDAHEGDDKQEHQDAAGEGAEETKTAAERSVEQLLEVENTSLERDNAVMTAAPSTQPDSATLKKSDDIITPSSSSADNVQAPNQQSQADQSESTTSRFKMSDDLAWLSKADGDIQHDGTSDPSTASATSENCEAVVNHATHSTENHSEGLDAATAGQDISDISVEEDNQTSSQSDNLPSRRRAPENVEDTIKTPSQTEQAHTSIVNEIIEQGMELEQPLEATSKGHDIDVAGIEADKPASSQSSIESSTVDETTSAEAQVIPEKDDVTSTEMVSDEAVSPDAEEATLSIADAGEFPAPEMEIEDDDEISAALVDTADAAVSGVSHPNEGIEASEKHAEEHSNITSAIQSSRVEEIVDDPEPTPALSKAPSRDASSTSIAEEPTEVDVTVDPTASVTDTPAKTSTFKPLSSSTPSTLPRLHRNSSKGQTYVGGMLASNKAMRPFRSPIIARKESATGEAQIPSTSTPSKTASTNEIKSSLGRTSMLSTSMSASSSISAQPSSPAIANRTAFKGPSFKTSSTPGDSVLNRPFKSLVSRRESTEDASGSSSNTAAMTNSEGHSMSSIQLSAELPKLERRLALLKDAKRHRIAAEKGLDTADNTDHIRELSLKWLEKGREAAEMLWELVKDNMDTNQGDTTQNGGDSGYGYGFDQDKSNNGNGNWGWDTADAQQGRSSNARQQRNGGSRFRETGTVEKLRQQVSDAIDALPEEERKALYEQLEEEGDDLPDLDPDEFIAKLQKKRASSYIDGRKPKRARLENDNDEGDLYGREAAGLDPDADEPMEEDNDALSDTAHDTEGKPTAGDDDEDEVEIEDDPTKRGMSKMLIQCGIDTKTFGWNPAQEEWEPLR